jgi:hypothetical protein
MVCRWEIGERWETEAQWATGGAVGAAKGGRDEVARCYLCSVQVMTPSHRLPFGV